MAIVTRSLLLVGAAATALLTAPVSPVREDLGKSYTPDQKEYHLTSDEVGYIRPGLKMEIVKVEIPDDRKPIVEVKFSDDGNQPLDRLGQETLGAISASFILAWWDGANRQYTSWTTRTVTSPITQVTTTQASTDSGGTWTEIEMGHYTYKFKTQLPSGYDRTKTHTLATYATRDLLQIIEKRYVVNKTVDFRPDGAAAAATWGAMETSTCNKCHDPLALHGGSRQDVKLCATCHSPQTIDPDTGNTVDFKVMVHKIHMGHNLPSVQAGEPYIIIGNRQSVHDYSHVALPQDIRNCTTCHEADAPEGSIWYSRPSMEACGSCHDDINWESGEGHPAGPQADNTACASCHTPQGEQEFDASIKGAHVIPEKSSQLAGLKVEILGVTNTAPGSKAKVTFKITNNDGSFVAPSALTSFALMIGGNTKDYSTYIRENARGATVSGDTATFEFAGIIPADATGTWVATADAYRNVTLEPGTADEVTFREAAYNPIFRFGVTDATPVARRTVVTDAKCNTCHDRLALHGGQRLVIDECLICHNPVTSDVSRRPADAGEPESIHFKRMIHRIHTGEELTQDLTIYGFGNTPHNYNEVLYPGDLRNCAKCHAAGTWNVPTPAGSLPTLTPRDFYSPQQPAAAACLGCHDNVDAAAHAYVNTAPFGEACAACHGTERDFSVDKVHAR